MLKTCYYEDRTLAFCKEDVLPNQNIFTIIVGKNGTGKSRLLKAIVENFISVSEPAARQHRLVEICSFPNNLQIDCIVLPRSIIALSTSPFDRFPIDIKNTNNYEYLGLRGLFSNNFSLSFIARTVNSLIRAVTENKSQSRIIAQVLHYLGYKGFIEARFETSEISRFIITILESDDPIIALRDLNNSHLSTHSNLYISRRRRINKLFEIDHEKLINAAKLWKNLKVNGRSSIRKLEIRIDSAGVFNVRLQEEIDELILFLLEFDFYRLRNIGLQKLSQVEKILIHDASSGEQCVLMAMLGIASHIKDNTLICIDEPEICLHPEWQERYIELLMTTFYQFSNCHFIVATHSPQVIAKLNDDNCYVLDLESGSTFIGRDLNKRSADFQLANVFKAPGYKNEYLSRELFNAVGILGSGGNLEKEHLARLTKMLSLKDLLEESDPVKTLMTILESSLKEIMGK